jgi:hypothetical protein
MPNPSAAANFISCRRSIDCRNVPSIIIALLPHSIVEVKFGGAAPVYAVRTSRS